MTDNIIGGILGLLTLGCITVVMGVFFYHPELFMVTMGLGVVSLAMAGGAQSYSNWNFERKMKLQRQLEYEEANRNYDWAQHECDPYGCGGNHTEEQKRRMRGEK